MYTFSEKVEVLFGYFFSTNALFYTQSAFDDYERGWDVAGPHHVMRWRRLAQFLSQTLTATQARLLLMFTMALDHQQGHLSLDRLSPGRDESLDL